MVYGYLLMELGKQSYWTVAFRFMGTVLFVELNHIIDKFGSCFLKKHGQKFLKAMITLFQDIMKKG